MLLLIDNYDSFTFNLAQAFGQLGEVVRVERNDAIDLAGIRALAPEHIVISPGPCTPNEAGISMEVIRELAGEVPILGVCLGHQAIGQVFGARVVRAARVMHGKVSKVFHDDGPLFAGVGNPFEATRYHSLVIDPATLPAELAVTAKTWDDVVMAVRRVGDEDDAPLEGLQFHPESIMTPDGPRMLGNFVALGRAYHAARRGA